MEAYFAKNYFYILNEGVIILATIVGLLHFKKYKQANTRYFIYFLVYVMIIELLGYYPKFAYVDDRITFIGKFVKDTILERNFLWYIIFWLLGSSIFLSFYFYRIIYNPIFKKIIKYSIVIFLMFSILYSLINYKVYYDDDLKLIWVFGGLQNILCCVLYFVEVLLSDRIIRFYRTFEFYVAAVFFVWLLIRVPITFYQMYFNTADWNFIFLRRDIILFSNVLMYLTFIFAFIFCKPDNEAFV
ncbi:hypothetical protein M0G43_11330 [Subsaxibacter sp. CAU 1640]|uniref:hypothetical protein n=1 Tax=Subsaxibacter sp. CAU 1640 TaxID=2933271 RepID=UPI002002BA41|nr:hypothetical protein [Subsaxibacter sp. CAU 1640]MCK7591168.1 hypothetical protein [Subsaxibacter sp. CAU 1640]